jgi:hypothetical protein
MALHVSCGGSTGDDNPCPNGDCSLPGRTVVKWMFDHYPEYDFPFDSCVDFSVIKVHVDAYDQTGAVQGSGDADCGEGQVTLENLPAGTYTMIVTPLDINGAPLVTTGASASVDAGIYPNNTEVTAYVPWTSWIGTFSGTFLFRLTWGGMSC